MGTAHLISAVLSAACAGFLICRRRARFVTALFILSMLANAWHALKVAQWLI